MIFFPSFEMTMSLSVFSRFRACRSSLVKLLSGKEADCKVEAILLLMLSLTGSGRSLWRDRTASILGTIVSVGIRLGVTECFSPNATEPMPTATCSLQTSN